MQTKLLTLAATAICGGAICATAGTDPGGALPVTIVVSESSMQPVGNHAVGQLQKHLVTEGVKARIAMPPGLRHRAALK